MRVAESDQSCEKIHFAYIDQKYKEWMIRRGFASELGPELGVRRSWEDAVNLLKKPDYDEK